MAVSEATRAAACELDQQVTWAMTVAEVINAAAGEREPTWVSHHWGTLQTIQQKLDALLAALRAEP